MSCLWGVAKYIVNEHQESCAEIVYFGPWLPMNEAYLPMSESTGAPFQLTHEIVIPHLEIYGIQCISRSNLTYTSTSHWISMPAPSFENLLPGSIYIQQSQTYSTNLTCLDVFPCAQKTKNGTTFQTSVQTTNCIELADKLRPTGLLQMGLSQNVSSPRYLKMLILCDIHEIHGRRWSTGVWSDFETTPTAAPSLC